MDHPNHPESTQGMDQDIFPKEKAFKSHGLIGLFARHRVAPNLLMIIMIIMGVVALTKLNVQFFPTLKLNNVSVTIVWTGATAEDIEKSVVAPVERVLRNLEGLDEMTSTMVMGLANIQLKFDQGVDMIEAVDQVNQKINGLRNLPQDIEKPVVERQVFYERIAKVVIVSEDGSLDEIRKTAFQFERELLAAGIDNIVINGMPEDEMAIELSQDALKAYGLSFQDVADKIQATSRDIPAGTVGDHDAVRDLRALAQGRSEADFYQIPLRSTATEMVVLGDVATITRRAQKESGLYFVEGKPAIELALERSEHGNTIDASEVMIDWLEKTEPNLPSSIRLAVYDESWELVKGRMMLLLTNGLGGLLLVILILYTFMHGRVSFWVTVGIPVSFMATLMFLWLSGGSINMISMFALIMALGIIVDDAIVVGEDALAHFERGEPALEAAEGGAYRMLFPVLAASLTTVAAFLPLMMIGSEIGTMLMAIPMVIIAVIIASLIESFMILPGHLNHAMKGIDRSNPSRMRVMLEEKFDHFRHHQFRALIRWSLANRAIVISVTMAMMIFVVGLIAGGRVGFVFFPSPDGKRLNADLKFVAGTPESVTAAFSKRLYDAIYEAEAALEPGIVSFAVQKQNLANQSKGAIFAGATVELTDPDQRSTSNEEFIKVWREKVGTAPGLERLVISKPRAGPPGSDIDIRMWGAEITDMKAASLELQQALHQISGIYSIRDDLPYGRDQLVYELTPEGLALGLTNQSVGAQLRNAFTGSLVQIYTEGDDEIEVRLQLPLEQQAALATLEYFQVQTPRGDMVPLNSVVTWENKNGFDELHHIDGLLSVRVVAEVDKVQNNANRVLASLEESTLPNLMAKYGVEYSYGGQSKNQARAMEDMLTGLIVGLAMMFIILTWVFSSYGWPLVVMAAIPFGLIGAILGHWWMGLDMTLLSLFGFFGLSGIVVNDSIILVSFYKRLREAGLPIKQALEEAAVQRVRAVILTSLTTIAGLTPLLFETSIQAQFLIPMAASIAFGLMFSTLLILLVIPAMLSLFEQVRGRRYPQGAAKAAKTEA